MGRVAGTPTSVRNGTQWRLEAFGRKRDRELRNPLPSTVTISKRQRKFALLWFIAENYNDGLMVNWIGCPRYTRDLKRLVAENYLSMKRERYGGNRMATILRITDCGIEELSRAKVSNSTKFWIECAFHNGTLS